MRRERGAGQLTVFGSEAYEEARLIVESARWTDGVDVVQLAVTVADGALRVGAPSARSVTRHGDRDMVRSRNEVP